MGTSSGAGVPREDLGIIPRVITELHDLMKANEKTHVFVLSLSFLEIYKSATTKKARADNALTEAVRSFFSPPHTAFVFSALFHRSDDIFDLLQPIPRGRSDRPVPSIKEGRQGGSGGAGGTSTGTIEVDGIVKMEVKSAEETMEVLDKGSLNRAVGSTAMNATSSRSHAIFTLQLAQKRMEKEELGGSNDEFITSKFHFVDRQDTENSK